MLSYPKKITVVINISVFNKTKIFFFLSFLFLIILLIFSSFAPPGSVVRSGSTRADLKEQMEDLLGKEYSDRLIDTISHDGKIFNLYESMSFRFENAKFNCKSPKSVPWCWISSLEHHDYLLHADISRSIIDKENGKTIAVVHKFITYDGGENRNLNDTSRAYLTADSQRIRYSDGQEIFDSPHLARLS